MPLVAIEPAGATTLAPPPAEAHVGARAVARHRPPAARIGPSRPETDVRIGIIRNAKARHNMTGHGEIVHGTDHATPDSHDELHEVLARFASRGVNALIIDGGDGTVRDVASAAARYFPQVLPRMAIVPSGKTNALAFDLGIPADWTTDAAVHAVRAGWIEERAPIEIWRPTGDAPDLRGFIFGAGAFVRATELAQTTHRFGAFNGLAVGLSIAGAITQTLFGGHQNEWRRGEPMRVSPAIGETAERAYYLLLASTLTRLPLDIKPFGQPRSGLKMLAIESPPRRLLSAVPAVLRGTRDVWLAKAGYHRNDSEQFQVTLAKNFILDGETFPGGKLTLRRGAPIRFVVP